MEVCGHCSALVKRCGDNAVQDVVIHMDRVVITDCGAEHLHAQNVPRIRRQGVLCGLRREWGKRAGTLLDTMATSDRWA